jgi:heat shock protein HslJ
VQLAEGLYLTGDIGADGRSEAAVFLAEQAAGSGNRLYLALMARDGSGTARNLATTLIGDRVQIIEASMSGDGITLRLVRAGPGDAACCPGEIASVRWTLIGGMLDQVSDRIEGRLSVAELSGSRWQLEHLVVGDAAVTGPGVTLAVDAGRISGRSGCNAYSGTIEDGDSPGQIRVGPLAGTRMACEPDLMKLEDAYLSGIEAADHFSFLTGALVLTSVDESGSITRLSFLREGDTPSIR